MVTHTIDRPLQTLTTHVPMGQKNLAFGYTNALLATVPELAQPILHFWDMAPTVILGLKDQRLPALSTALRELQGHGYNWVLRNSGGLAVVADPGVLNVSWFQPLGTPPLSVDTAYTQLVDYLQLAWPELTLTTGEISQSYCPGTYDLSVNGLKIAGLAQRRDAHAVVTMLYLSVTGDQVARGTRIADLYATGLAGHENTWHFPAVDPHSMTTLATLLHQPVTLAQAQARILAAFQQTGYHIGHAKLASFITQPHFQTRLAHATAVMAKRQPKLTL